MNNFLWLLLAVLALALSWFAESAILAWVACVIFLMALISWIQVRFLPQLEVNRILSAAHLHPGEKLRVWVRLRMPRRHWGWLLASDAAPPLPLQGNRGVILGPAQAKEVGFSYTVKATRRGYYAIGPLSLRAGDSFGFAEARQVMLEAEHITVFPRVVELQRGRLRRAAGPGELQTLRRTFEDTTRPAGIRDYRSGDPLRRIHWRATAHLGRPKAKLYDVCTSLQVMMALNLYRPDYPPGPAEADRTSELAISLTASLGNHLLGVGQRVGLVSNGLDVKEREGFLREAGVSLLPESVARISDELAQRQRIVLAPNRSPERPLEMLSQLARLQVCGGRPFDALLEEIRRTISWGEMVVAVTPALDGAGVEALTGLTRAGFSVFVIVVGDSFLAARTHLQLAAAKIASQRVTHEEEIGGLFA